MEWSRFQLPPKDAQLPEEAACGGLWQYGEEASLYSIAEDSREDHVSVLSSSHPSGHHGTAPLAAKDALQSSWFLGSFPPASSSSSRNTTPAPTRMPVPSSSSSLPSAMGVELSIANGKSFDACHDDDDELFYYYHPGRRRLWKHIGRIGLLCLLLSGIAVSTTFAVTGFQNRRNRQSHISSSGSQTSASVEATAAADAALEEDEEQFSALAENAVFNALSSCPGGSSAHLFDPNTYEGQVFAELVREVSAGATSDPTTGSVILDDTHTTSYLQERFALEVLFHSTMGNAMWERHDGWMNGGDPCDDWMGVECAVPRSPSSTCAVTGLYLDNNGLSGQLMPALCCLPCVQHLEMANNAIGGPVLTCLAQMASLESIRFENNQFGTDPTTTASASSSSNTVVTLEARANGSDP